MSRLHEIMRSLRRAKFVRLVKSHQADKHAKGFGFWDLLVAMVYAQRSGANSLRGLKTSFNSQGTHHDRLGTGLVRRTPLADSLARRQTAVFAETTRLLIAHTGNHVKRDGAKLMYVLDSTSITLKGSGIDTWTGPKRNGHPKSIKPYVLYENDAPIPVQHNIHANDIDEGAGSRSSQGRSASSTRVTAITRGCW